MPGKERMSLEQIYLEYNESYFADRFLEYAWHYEAHLPPPSRNEPIHIMEIGVQSGGSARIWRQWYGESLRYTGVDINPLAARAASPRENIVIEIGDQVNATFLQHVCVTHGPFDVVIDDGMHTAHTISASVQFLFPHDSCMATKSIYVVEDAMVMRTKGYAPQGPGGISWIAAEAWESIHHYYAPQKPGWLFQSERSSSTRDRRVHPIFKDLVSEVHLYDGMVFIMRDHNATGSQNHVDTVVIRSPGKHEGKTRTILAAGPHHVQRGWDRIPEVP